MRFGHDRQQLVDRRQMPSANQCFTSPAAHDRIGVVEQCDQPFVRCLARVDAHQVGGFGADLGVIVAGELHQQLVAGSRSEKLHQIEARVRSPLSALLVHRHGQQARSPLLAQFVFDVAQRGGPRRW